MISWLRQLSRPHPVSQAELGSYVDGRLQGPRALEVEGHAKSCASCAAEVEELRSLLSVLSGLPQLRPQRSFAITEARVEARAARTARPVSRPMWAPAMALSALLVLLAVDFMSIGTQSDDAAGFATGAQKAASESVSPVSAPPVLADAARNVSATPAPPPVGAAATQDRTATGAASGAEAATSTASQFATPAAQVQAPPREQARDEAAPRSEEGESAISLIRVLEAIAGLALAGSIAYALRRPRRA